MFLLNKKIYRVNVFGGTVGFLGAILTAVADKSVWGDGKYILWGNVFAALLNFCIYYLFKKEKEDKNINKYALMIDELSSIGVKLRDLKTFLEQEQTKVTETQEVIDRLNKEKQKLEPVVKASREQIKSILDAYEKNSTKNIWLNYILSFILGLF